MKTDYGTAWWFSNFSENAPKKIRAELKRATIDNVAFTDGFLNLWRSLPEEEKAKHGAMERWGAIAIALSKVKTNSETTLAKAASKPKGNGSTTVSPARFQHLLKAKSSTQFLLYLGRITHMIGSECSVRELERDIHTWFDERTSRVPPAQRVAVRWALQYHG